MRIVSALATVAFLAGCATTVRAEGAAGAATAEARKADVADLQKAYVQFLKDEGYSPSVNKDGNVEFKFEGYRYVIFLDANDRAFFQLVFPGFWKVEGEADRQKAIAAAHLASQKTKVAKVLVGTGAAYATFDAFVKDPSDVSAFFRRALNALRLSVKTFSDEMTKK